MYLFESGRWLGVRFEAGGVRGVDVEGGRVRGVRLSSGVRIESPIFINAAGPFLKEVGRLVGIDLPVYTELHLKAVIKDALGVVGRAAPLLIWNDAQSLPWADEEREALAEDDETRWLTEVFPSGVHTRPEGGGTDILMLWEYHTDLMEPVDTPAMDEQYPEIALRGPYNQRMKEIEAQGGRLDQPPEMKAQESINKFRALADEKLRLLKEQLTVKGIDTSKFNQTQRFWASQIENLARRKTSLVQNSLSLDFDQQEAELNKLEKTVFDEYQRIAQGIPPTYLTPPAGATPIQQTQPGPLPVSPQPVQPQAAQPSTVMPKRLPGETIDQYIQRVGQ